MRDYLAWKHKLEISKFRTIAYLWAKVFAQALLYPSKYGAHNEGIFVDKMYRWSRINEYTQNTYTYSSGQMMWSYKLYVPHIVKHWKSKQLINDLPIKFKYFQQIVRSFRNLFGRKSYPYRT